MKIDTSTLIEIMPVGKSVLRAGKVSALIAPYKLEVGKTYILALGRKHTRNVVRVKFIKVTQKGYNFLNVLNSTCLLKTPIYASKQEHHEAEKVFYLITSIVLYKDEVKQRSSIESYSPVSEEAFVEFMRAKGIPAEREIEFREALARNSKKTFRSAAALRLQKQMDASATSTLKIIALLGATDEVADAMNGGITVKAVPNAMDENGMQRYDLVTEPVRHYIAVRYPEDCITLFDEYRYTENWRGSVEDRALLRAVREHLKPHSAQLQFEDAGPHLVAFDQVQAKAECLHISYPPNLQAAYSAEDKKRRADIIRLNAPASVLRNQQSRVS
jgi:hypothetical protein